MLKPVFSHTKRDVTLDDVRHLKVSPSYNGHVIYLIHGDDGLLYDGDKTAWEKVLLVEVGREYDDNVCIGFVREEDIQ